MASHSNRREKKAFFPLYLPTSIRMMNIFELTIPRTEHPQKNPNLPPSLLSPPIHPSIQPYHRKRKQNPPTKKEKRRLTADKNYAMKPNLLHPILFYDERETNDRSLILNFKTKKKIRKFEKKISVEKMIFLRVRLVYMLYILYIHTYMVPPTIHI